MKNKFLILLFLCSIFLGCNSIPVKSEPSEFSGFVIDENNKPLENVVIKILGSDFSEITTVTNQSGMFVFSEIKTGDLNVLAYKEGYTKYDEKIEFYNRDKILCIQICSADLVLDNIEKAVLIKDFENARKQLNSIYCNDSKNLKWVLNEYKKVIGEKKNENKKNL